MFCQPPDRLLVRPPNIPKNEPTALLPPCSPLPPCCTAVAHCFKSPLSFNLTGKQRVSHTRTCPHHLLTVSRAHVHINTSTPTSPARRQILFSRPDYVRWLIRKGRSSDQGSFACTRALATAQSRQTPYADYAHTNKKIIMKFRRTSHPPTSPPPRVRSGDRRQGGCDDEAGGWACACLPHVCGVVPVGTSCANS